MTDLESAFRRAKPILLRAVRRPDADFSFHLVGSREMEDIRRSLLAREDFNGPEARKIAAEEMVNVLAFPAPSGFPHPETKKIALGEVYLNADFGDGRYETLGPLGVHGFLHLLGYLHRTKRDTIKMQDLEKHLWGELMSRI